MSRRYVRHPLSADRSYNETITDIQNTFVWEKKHVFRPHQHFTYDPASWSRPLVEKAKHERTLSLLERLKALEERAAEARSREGTTQVVPDSISIVTTDLNGREEGSDMAAGGMPGEAAEPGPSLSSSSASQRPLTSTPLQELLDEALQLSKALHMPRTARKMGLRQQEKLHAQHHLVLIQLFHRIQHAVIDETITLNALIYTWFVLIHEVSELIPALSQPTIDGEGLEEWVVRSEEDAIRTVFDSLTRTLLTHVVCADTIAARWEQEHPSLEEVIELMSILLHPFTKKGLRTWHATTSLGPLEESLLWGYDLLQSALLRRITTVETTSEESRDEGDPVATCASTSTAGVSTTMEWLDSLHLQVLLDAAGRICTLTSVEADLPRYYIMVKSQAQHLLKLHQCVIPGANRWRHWRHTLTDLDKVPSKEEKRTVFADDQYGDPEATTLTNPKAVVLDPTTPPRGVQHPLTQADDVHYCTKAFMRLLELSLSYGVRPSAVHSGPNHDGALRSTTDAMLHLLSYAPNYDLDPTLVASLSWHLIGLDEAGFSLWVGETERPLRWMLLLSRMDFSSSKDRVVLGKLALRLCHVGVPPMPSKRQELDWLRLRGVAMGHLLSVLRPADLDAAGRASGDGGAWEEHLAFYEFDGLIPIELWRAACAARFPDASPWVLAVSAVQTGCDPLQGGAVEGCPPAVALALLVLRGRLVTEKRQSRRAPLDETSFAYIAACVEALTEGRVSKQQLAHLPDIWDECVADMERWGEQVLPLLAEAKTYVLSRRNVGPNKVHTF
ncbi:unnamed protein product [Phytomonas sp. EM1]|nr:unnamed protein product [Phytomonas sp. EM1]|eukprot:CCW64965.1 unnamed protein product [Phytomonas sp. isolate EM1]